MFSFQAHSASEKLGLLRNCDVDVCTQMCMFVFVCIHVCMPTNVSVAVPCWQRLEISAGCFLPFSAYPLKQGPS